MSLKEILTTICHQGSVYQIYKEEVPYVLDGDYNQMTKPGMVELACNSSTAVSYTHLTLPTTTRV